MNLDKKILSIFTSGFFWWSHVLKQHSFGYSRLTPVQLLYLTQPRQRTEGRRGRDRDGAGRAVVEVVDGFEANCKPF